MRWPWTAATKSNLPPRCYMAAHQGLFTMAKGLCQEPPGYHPALVAMLRSAIEAFAAWAPEPASVSPTAAGPMKANDLQSGAEGSQAAAEQGVSGKAAQSPSARARVEDRRGDRANMGPIIDA